MILLTEAPSPTLPASIEDQLLEAIIAPASDPGLQDSRTQDSSPSPHPITVSPNHPIILAKRFGLSLRLLLDFLSSPSTRARIAAAVELQELAHLHRAHSARAKALTALESILDTTEDPIEKRRAASAILTRSGAPRLHSHSPSLPLSHSSPKPLRPEPDLPCPKLSPQDVVRTCIERLQDNDNPFPSAGLTTLHNFKHLHATPKFRESLLEDYIEDPGADAALVGAQATILHPPESPEPAPDGHPDRYVDLKDRFIQRITLCHSDHTRRDAVFHLRRDTNVNNIHDHRWFISRIEHLDARGPDPDNSPKPPPTSTALAPTVITLPEPADSS